MKERQDEIRKFIAKRGDVSIAELCAVFSSWSEMTIRRDLEVLEKAKFLIRTKGGARVLPTRFGISEDVYGERESRNPEWKLEIAEKARSLIESDTGIYLDAGTTSMALARELPDTNLVVITSAPNIGLEVCAKMQNPTVILLGGTLSRKSLCASGAHVLDQLSNLNIDTAFMSASGFTEQSGFTVGSQAECDLKRCVINRARRVVLLFDSSKAGAMMPFTFAKLDEIDILVADSQLPEEYRKIFRQAEVRVL